MEKDGGAREKFSSRVVEEKKLEKVKGKRMKIKATSDSTFEHLGDLQNLK